jgi:hypothetical protein
MAFVFCHSPALGDGVTDKWVPLRFIDQPIEVRFDRPPTLSKTPGPPQAFILAGQELKITRVLARWTSYDRRGRQSRNMQPAHLARAGRKGSWGVGRFYFRVETAGGGVFDLYYDRAPKAAGQGAGSWVLWRQMKSAAMMP